MRRPDTLRDLTGSSRFCLVDPGTLPDLRWTEVSAWGLGDHPRFPFRLSRFGSSIPEEMKVEDFKRKKATRQKRRARALKKVALVPSRTPVDQWTTKTRERLSAKENGAETKVDALLHSLPVVYRRERPFEILGKKYFADFLVSSLTEPNRRKIRVVVEVDGGYHFTPEQQVKDRAKEAALLTSSRVWSILRISAEKAMGMTREHLREHLLSMDPGTVRRVY